MAIYQMMLSRVINSVLRYNEVQVELRRKFKFMPFGYTTMLYLVLKNNEGLE